ncbi:MAG: tripartite tricarboxylate transporter substrate binding protein [Betaproteobacteria bacterium]|nr:tripartite tricarboxylate transporter substrate binding protein [Betaproteobacteria bacterium]
MKTSLPRAAGLVAIAALAAFPLLATAQSYPNKPLRLVVPFPAGGATDVLARIVGGKLAEGLGHAVVIDNRAGASGAIATEYVAKSAPDGYTLLMATVGTQAINPAVSKVAFDPVADFTAVGIVGTAPLGLVIHPSVQATNVKELVALAKKSPGRLDMASFGTGTASHLAGELFKSMTGTFMVHVPYKGGAPAMTDLIAGQVSVYFDTLSNTLQPARAGRIRLLAVTSAQRNAAVPDVPTVAEAGVPGYEAVTWFGLFGPAKLPREVVTRVNAEIARVMAQADVKQKLAAQGTDPVSGAPEVLGDALKKDYAKWARLVKERGLKLD